MKRCLIVSYGPIPTPEYQQVDGGSMRTYGLATGLTRNGIDVTVAINANFPQTIKQFEGINLTNWKQDNEFIKLINSFDAVIASYSLGDNSTFIQKNIADDVQFIVDAYVPSYIEVSARESKDLANEYLSYFRDLSVYNATLSRGDYFLVANDTQQLLYTGVLSALGVINPASYHTKRIIETPFGIHDTPLETTGSPYEKLGIKKGDFKVLWFGGMYPWFRIEEYLAAIKELSRDKTIKFIFVGAKNPRNDHPDFVAQYDIAVEYIKKHNLSESVSFVDWVNFDERSSWYSNADVIVSLNQPAEENKYSWRTRVMDFVWGEGVILTNGGDPLSETLIKNNAAVRLDSLTSESIVEAIQKLRTHPGNLLAIKKEVVGIKPRYYWHIITREISDIIKAGSLPYKNENRLRGNIPAVTNSNLNVESKASRLLGVSKKIFVYAKSKGLKRTGGVIVRTLKGRSKTASLRRNRKPQFVFISHPRDNTGAPLVLLNIIEEFTQQYGSNRIRVIASGVTPNNLKHLQKLGITVEHAMHGIGFRSIRLQLGLKPNDFVLMNTSAVYPNYLQFILLWLKLGRLKHAHWFIHEDLGQCSELIESHTSLLQPLLKTGKLSLYFPSKKTMQAFTKPLGTKGLKSMIMRSDVDEAYKKPLAAKDFNSLRFVISGTTPDGRKGQLITIAALQHFLDTYYRENPKNYRNFTLTLISVGEGDYVSQQVRWIGKSSLGNHIKIYKNMERHKALEIASKSNVVICSSLHETYALYVAESMLMGHVVLRSNVGGIDEQLVDGVNGYYIDVTDIQQFSSVLEKILNKQVTTNVDLEKMGESSRRIAKNFEDSSYIKQLSAS